MFEFNDEKVEGFVIEDSNGFQFKVKCMYYNFWKSVRRIVKENGNINKALAYMTEEQQTMLKEVVEMFGDEMTLFELRKKYESKH